MRLTIDTGDLLNWAKFAEQQVQKSKPLLASALNQLGDSLSRNIAIDLSRSVGLPVDTVRGMMDTARATTKKLEYEIDIAKLTDPRLLTNRPLPARDFPRREETGFAASELVNVQTAGDDNVCETCEGIAEAGPYTIEVARAMIPHHPNCRCTLVPFTPTRRIPVTYSTRFGAAPRPAMLSVPQLVARILKESTLKMLIK